MRQLGLAGILAITVACGYHVSGHGDLLPKNIKTIAIPASANVTTHYELSRRLPEDIAREFISRTRYAVVSDPNQADAILNTAVVNYFAYPTTIDPVSGRATAAVATVILQLRLTDRATGKILFNRPNADFRQEYEISENPQQYFDESATAMARLSRDVAQNVVTAVLENF